MFRVVIEYFSDVQTDESPDMHCAHFTVYDELELLCDVGASKPSFVNRIDSSATELTASSGDKSFAAAPLSR